MVNVGRMPGSLESLPAWSVGCGVKGPLASAHRLAVCALYVRTRASHARSVCSCSATLFLPPGTFGKWNLFGLCMTETKFAGGLVGQSELVPADQTLSGAAPSMF